MTESIVYYNGAQHSKCGYCKGSGCSQSHSMHAYCMTVLDYQDLIDRGWRRSGNYCYKPNNKITCCPCYTIRCDAQNFKLSKSHKKILKRMNRFLRDGKCDKDEIMQQQNQIANDACGGDNTINEHRQIPKIPLPMLNFQQITSSSKIETEEVTGQIRTKLATTAVAPAAFSESVADNASSLASAKSDAIKPPCKKAKQIRLERRAAKLAAKGASATAKVKQKLPEREKTLSDYLNEASDMDKHKLKIKCVALNTLNSFTDEAYQLYYKYQLIVHNDNPTRLTQANMQRFLYKSPLQLKLVHVDGNLFKHTLSNSYALYQKYQKCVHNDPPKNVNSYLEFLQESPLEYSRPCDGPDMGYGSFHQQYWLDDKLIAVGVIDILPYCVSSVYFFYDPDYNFLSLGTYSALREIDLVQRLALDTPALNQYYMGYYIHSCPKMRYKGKLSPSYLLCPETYEWQLLTDDIRAKLDAQKYQRLNPDANAVDQNSFIVQNLDMVPLFLSETRQHMTYRQYIQSFNIESLDNMLDMVRSSIYRKITGDDDDRDLIIEYGKLVGKTCAHRLRLLKD